MAATVLIVDDDAEFRAIARAVLTTGDFEVLGEASSGAEAISAVLDLHPDVVLLDVQLPDTDGFSVAAVLAGSEDRPSVVLCSVLSPPHYAQASSACGAAGFLPKLDLSAAAVGRLVGAPPVT